MQRCIILTLLLIISSIAALAQAERCGTMKQLQEKIKDDPLLKEKMDIIEAQTNEYLKKVGETNYSPQNESKRQTGDKKRDIQSLCGYNNVFLATIAAPTIVNQIVSLNPNCVYGGEYVTLTGLISGRTYRISLCGVNNFDTQLTIYPQGGGNAVAHNDDWCASQSEIYFTPMLSGNYDLLVDAYNCNSNALCANLAVELWNIPRSKITIPVVVHVMHFGEPIGTGRNLSVAQISSQIAVLNRDFRRLNSDINAIPAAFRGWSADPLIEFCLAKQDELGNSTSGITRHLGSMSSWGSSQIETSVKPTTIWNRNQYLNFWTLEFGGADSSTLGYAQFPGGSANTDGVVIGFNVFGSTGNVVAPYNLGRTAVHEVGHWLNLRHIWGDENACAQDDFVSDTPLQGQSSSGVPSYPNLDACQVDYPGIMFYNYMDYSNDAVTSMFTYGQWARMDAALFNTRSSLFNSKGCSGTTGVDESAINSLVQISPNPSAGLVNLNTDVSLVNKSVSIYVSNFMGQNWSPVSTYEKTENGLQINFNTLPDGVYLVKIMIENQSVIKKLILSR